MTNQKTSPREETAEAIAAAALFFPFVGLIVVAEFRVGAAVRKGSKGPQVSRELRGNVLLVTIHESELQDELTVGPLRYASARAVELTYPRLEVFDLGQVTSMSSRAVGLLLAHNQALGRHGRKDADLLGLSRHRDRF